MAPRALDIAGIPDYRWDAHQHPQKDGYRSVVEDENQEHSQRPDYRWDQHPAANKPKSLCRANSDLTDYEPKINKQRQQKRRPKKGDLRRANSDLTGFDPTVQKQRRCRRRPKKVERNPEEEKEEEEAEEEIEEVIVSGSEGEGPEDCTKPKKSRKRTPTRAKSDLTSYESSSTRDKRAAGNRRGKKRPKVRFSSEEPHVDIRPTMSEEEKAVMFYSKAELFEMKRDRDEEKAEEIRERRNRTYGDNSAKLGSIWGSSSNAVKPNKVVSKLHGDKPKEKSESEKKMESTFETLQLAMEQAKMITGY